MAKLNKIRHTGIAGNHCPCSLSVCVTQEICLCDSPVVMALVDGPTGENDHMICVAYKHQFDLINESTGDAYRLHHVDSNRVSNAHMHIHMRSVLTGTRLIVDVFVCR